MRRSRSNRCWARGKAQVTFDRVPVDEAVKYAAEDADVTLRLWQPFKPQLHRAQVTTVYETLERPLVPVLAEMEMAGIQVDRDTLSPHVQRLRPEDGGAGGRDPRAGRRDVQRGLAPSNWARSCSTR